MKIEKQFQDISQSQFSAPDGDSFLEKLHNERQHRIGKKVSFLNGLSAGIIVAVFGLITTSQLTDDPTIFASSDLTPLEIMDNETEEFVYELAEYLVENSDDIWETLTFLDEIEFETVVTMNNGGLE